MLPDKCEIGGVAIECNDYLVEENNNVQIQFVNSVGNNIAIHSITIKGEGDSTGLWGSSCEYAGDGSSVPPADYDADTSISGNDAFLFVNGEQATFTFSGCSVKIPAGKNC